MTDIGVVGTDMLYFYVASRDLDGGAIITASHNPKEYNGIKMVRRGALALSGDAGIKEIRRRWRGRFADADSGDRAALQATSSPTTTPSTACPSSTARRDPGLKVVMDTGNGMGAVAASAIFPGCPWRR